MPRDVRDPLAAACETCPAGSGELCDAPIGLHWSRARAAGMSPAELLSWEPAARPQLPAFPCGDDVAVMRAALLAATDLAEQHGAPARRVEVLRGVARAVRR